MVWLRCILHPDRKTKGISSSQTTVVRQVEHILE